MSSKPSSHGVASNNNPAVTLRGKPPSRQVTVDGIGTATYTEPEHRAVRRLVRAGDMDAARLIHELKVEFPGSHVLYGDEDLAPDDQGEQLTL